MIDLLKNPVTPVWLLLVIATGLSWWLGTGDGAASATNVATMSTMVIIVAFVKVRFVVRYFMEVRDAPFVLKIITDAWLLVVSAAILLLYWQVV